MKKNRRLERGRGKKEKESVTVAKLFMPSFFFFFQVGPVVSACPVLMIPQLN